MTLPDIPALRLRRTPTPPTPTRTKTQPPTAAKKGAQPPAWNNPVFGIGTRIIHFVLWTSRRSSDGKRRPQLSWSEKHKATFLLCFAVYKPQLLFLSRAARAAGSGFICLFVLRGAGLYICFLNATSVLGEGPQISKDSAFPHKNCAYTSKKPDSQAPAAGHRNCSNFVFPREVPRLIFFLGQAGRVINKALSPRVIKPKPLFRFCTSFLRHSTGIYSTNSDLFH